MALNRMNPTPAIVIRLLNVMLITMLAHPGKSNPKISGGGKNVQRYPPTINPMINEPDKHARKGLLRRIMIALAAKKFANGPRITSNVPIQ